ncbi:expressed unknown protein [Seminavis robusta]|uniref:Uncharacterized protein n=1 Tax=Seminavis robusta TaxID=568900 RepID=A0A9N8ED29_9STRA|nr:expressed unknown protein [Seminavis robusta]|eukprot:Sro901_g217980.1 n/a (860) ;mRNA; r:13324-15903
MSATREALSRSMANLDFDPEQGKRRARTNRSKRDMSASCSAFNFILDKDEMEQAAGTGKSGKRSTKSSSGKPSYSDLIMDATSKSHQYQQSGRNPTAVAEGEESDGEAAVENRRSSDTTNKSNESNNSSKKSTEETIRELVTASAERKPSRVIPTSNDFNNHQRPNNRTRGLARSKSSNSYSNLRSSRTNKDGGEPPSPPKTRRARKLSRDTNKPSRNNLHMSMTTDFPRPSEIDAEPTTKLSPRSKRAAKAKSTRDFSKSFAGFDDWNPHELNAEAVAVAAPRKGRRPVEKSSSKDQDEFAAFLEERNSENQNNNNNNNSFSNSSNNNPRLHNSFSGTFDNSLSELDLFNIAGEQEQPPREEEQEEEEKKIVKKKSSKSCHGKEKRSKRAKPQQSRHDRFAKSFSCFDLTPHDLVSTTSGSSSTDDAAAKSRRSSQKLDPTDFFANDDSNMDNVTVATAVATQKVSAEEFHKQQSNSWSAASMEQGEESPTEDNNNNNKAISKKSSRNRRDGHHRSSANSRQATSTSKGQRGLRRSKSEKERPNKTRSTSKTPEKQARGSSKGPAHNNNNNNNNNKSHRSASKDRGMTKRSSSKDTPRRSRHPSQGPMRRASQGMDPAEEKGLSRGVSRDSKEKRRRSTMGLVSNDVNEDVHNNDPAPAPERRMARRGSNPEEATTSSPPQRRAPRRTRSTDGCAMKPMRDRSTATAATVTEGRLGGRRGPRRTKSTDGGTTFVRRGSTGNFTSDVEHNLHKSLSKLPRDALPSHSFSGGDTIVSESTTSRSSGEGGKIKPTTRRKMPQRSKSSQDFGSSMTFTRRTTRERGDSTKEGRATKQHRSNSSKDILGRAERRAMAHKLLVD